MLSIPGGVLADRVSKQKLQLTMQALVGDLHAGHRLLRRHRRRALDAVRHAALIGVANALNAPAFQSSMPLLVHRQDLPGAISLNSAMMNGTRVVGPVLAALLFAALGCRCRSVFIVNAFTYLFFIAALLYVRMPDVKSIHAAKGWRQLGTGMHTVRERLVLSRLLLGMFLFSLFSLVLHRAVPVGRPPRVRHRVGRATRTAGCTPIWGTGAFSERSRSARVLALVDRKVLIVRGFVALRDLPRHLLPGRVARRSPFRSRRCWASPTS